MTYARAGHTPLIYMPGAASPVKGAQILIPNGMVLGLRIDGAEEKFAELLEEEQVALVSGRHHRALHRRHHRGDERRQRSLRRRSAQRDRRGARPPRVRRSCASASCARSKSFVGAADQHDDMTMILMKVQPAMPARVAV